MRPLNERDRYFNWFSDIFRHLESLAVKKNMILKLICFSRLHLVHQSEALQPVQVKCGGAPTYRITAILIKTDYCISKNVLNFREILCYRGEY